MSARDQAAHLSAMPVSTLVDFAWLTRGARLVEVTDLPYGTKRVQWVTVVSAGPKNAVTSPRPETGMLRRRWSARDAASDQPWRPKVTEPYLVQPCRKPATVHYLVPDGHPLLTDLGVSAPER